MEVSSLQPETLRDVLGMHAAQAEALQFAGRWISFGELDAMAANCAAIAWHEWGVRPGDRVAWLGANHVQQIALLFGMARIGAMLLPLNFRLALPEWRGLLADCTPRHLVHGDEWAEAARELSSQCILHSVDELAQAA